MVNDKRLSGSQAMTGFGSGSKVYTLMCANDYGETAVHQ